ncbi:MAG TPA: TIGR01459 family HAD-type hydrolase [Rhizobiaceae bacterium]|nr:TIGR01459 family HAD-type hydrolase [Rhizobiaceae bacterium]
MPRTPNMIGSLDEISGRYAAILSDVWGVVHNGINPHLEAAAALKRARKQGVAIVLITNSPRPSADVISQMETIGVPRDAWDRVVSSGDVTRELVRVGPRKLFHLGPDRDLNLYDGLGVDLVEEFEASGVCCTGLFDDEVETPDDYADMLKRLRARNLPFICANPDIVVERGERLIWCAGALARDYAQLGGRTEIAGKPHKPIYEAALAAASELLKRPITPRDALAIGDGVLTDVKGADQNGIDILYVSGGIHAKEYGETLNPDAAMLLAFLERHGHRPIAAIPKLR